MAIITLNIPAPNVQNIQDALCDYVGVPSTAQNAKDGLAKIMLQITSAYNKKLAIRAQEASDSTMTIIIT